jgi:cytochrome c oxidase assembly protein subunit 15
MLVALVFAQIVMGGFVAGLNAGFGYNTWPLMDGAIIPTGLGVMEPAWRNLFENALTVQFVHRMIAYVIVAFALVQAWLLARAGAGTELKRSSLIVFVAVLAQAGLGVATLLSGMHTGLALLHQGAALAVLALALGHMHATFPARA